MRQTHDLNYYRHNTSHNMKYAEIADNINLKYVLKVEFYFASSNSAIAVGVLYRDGLTSI